MTTLIPPPVVSRSRNRKPAFVDVVNSEWTKARTVPSTMWALLIAVALGVGLSALFSALAAHAYATAAVRVRVLWDPTAISTSGGSLAQLAIGVLGTLAITSEYATRQIRISLTAVPRRGRLFAAKALVTAAIALVTGEVAMFAAFFLGQALIGGYAPTASLGQPGVLRAVIGCGLYITLIALLGLGIGVLLRSTAASVSVLVAILYVLPALALALPTSIAQNVEKYWPTQAGSQITNVVRGAHALSPSEGFADMAAFLALVLITGWVVLARRDV